MRKISIVVVIAILCSFAVVRRREQIDGEHLFQDAITQVMDRNGEVVYQVSGQQEVVGNGNNLLWDYPTSAAQLLSTGFDDVVFVTSDSQLSWLPISSVRSTKAPALTPLFWDLN